MDIYILTTVEEGHIYQYTSSKPDINEAKQELLDKYFAYIGSENKVSTLDEFILDYLDGIASLSKINTETSEVTLFIHSR